jgi:two-component system sensor histidine kinase/response regulator
MAVDQSAESIVITDLEIRITYVNESFLRQTGYARDELIGRNPRILKSGKTPREAYEALWSALRQGQTWRGELVNRRKDGSEFIEFAIISPIRSADGTVTHYVAVKEDITERKRLAPNSTATATSSSRWWPSARLELEQARVQAEAANRPSRPSWPT